MLNDDEAAGPRAVTPGRALRRDTSGEWTNALLVVAIAGLLLARIPILGVRYFDADELEHSHAAWCVWKGLLPYKDFFEHHTPWYYYVLQPFFHVFDVEQSFDGARSFLLFGRGLSLALCAASAVLLYQIGRLLGGAGRRVGLVAAALFVGQPVVIQKTLEIRPDVFALPFLLGGLWFLLRGLVEPERPFAASVRWFLAGGLCLGGAVMGTQKMLFALPGVFVGLGLWALGGGLRRARTRVCLGLVVLGGVALPGLLTWAAFALHGGGAEFIQNNFLLNARWRVRTSRYVGAMFETAWPIALLGLLGAGAALYRFRRAARCHFGELLLLGTVAGLLAGVAVMPVPYRQYYLMPLSIACLFAAEGLHLLAGLGPRRVRAWLVLAGTAPLLGWAAVELKAASRQHDEGQIARLRYVLEHTSPADVVMDGWLGMGVFRPHAVYHFFMHTELRAMLSDHERAAYVEGLRSGRIRPELIVLDRDLAALDPSLVDFVRSTHVTNDGLFYRPNHGGSSRLSARANFRVCPPAGSAATPLNAETFRAAISRKWLACHYAFVGGEDGDAIGTQGDGLEIEPGGRYRHLVRDAAGKLVGLPGPESEGTITYGRTSFGAVQTTFRSDSNQTLVTAPVITAQPTLLIIKTANADHRYIAAEGP